MAERTATTVWKGGLLHGSGQFSVGSGAFGPQDVTWEARTESAEGKTSPEELIAAAHASCYSMAFSHHLTTKGHKPEQLTVTSTVGFGPKEGGGMQVTHSHLTVVGKVEGLTADEFAQEAVEAEAGCPVSNALRGNLEITVEATLA